MNCANHPDRERKAFCQNCGKPLCVECARTVGQAVFCEPCLELRLAASSAGTSQPFGPGPTAGPATYQTVAGSTGYAATAAADGIPYTPRTATPLPGSPSPGVAFALGFCPGVGAMYNGQYAKGVVHLIVFAILVSLSDQNGIFGVFVAAWIFYQAFEAYHTARARRDGTPLPNPFGLNDIGERLGFGRSWPTASTPSSSPLSGASGPTPVPPPPPFNPASDPSYAPSGFGPSSYADRVPPAGGTAPAWGAPTDAFSQPVPAASPATSAIRFPVGAVILIALGVLFLLGSTHLFVALPLHYLLPFLLIGIGVYLFVRHMTATGASLAGDGTVAYRLRLVRALQSSVWVVLVGVLFLLDNLNILSWGRSWPLFIIVGGVMAFVQRSVYTAAAREMPVMSYPAANPSTPPPPVTDPGTSLVPRDREGS